MRLGGGTRGADGRASLPPASAAGTDGSFLSHLGAEYLEIPYAFLFTPAFLGGGGGDFYSCTCVIAKGSHNVFVPNQGSANFF